jgi:RNA polymerase sigma-70 factor, ECF subfamily
MSRGSARGSWRPWRNAALPERVPQSSPAASSLATLAARAQLGDRGALEGLLRALQGVLFEHIRGILRDEDVAADVLQDTLLIICRRLGTVRELQWVRAWAYRVATREAVRAARRASRSGVDALDDWPDLPAVVPDEPAVDPALQARMLARLEALPPRAQTVLRLRYLQELSQAEISEALEIPLGTVKSRLAYGLAALRSTVSD